MKKIISLLAVLLCLLLFSSCALLPEKETEQDVTLLVWSSTTREFEGETTVSRCYLDRAFQRSDGLCEVVYRCIADGSDSVEYVRDLYAPDGTPLGERVTIEDGQETYHLFPIESTIDSVLAYESENIERVEGTRIFYKSGYYTENELDGSRITRVRLFDAENRLLRDLRLNRIGLTEEVTMYGPFFGESDPGEQMHLRMTFQEVVPERGAAAKKETDPDVTLSVPAVRTVSFQGEESVYRCSVEKTLRREDGYYEVYVRCLEDDVIGGEPDRFVCLYLPDGTPVGTQKIQGYSFTDFIDLFDTTRDSFLAGAAETVDHTESNRVCYKDGGYTELDLDGERILGTRTFGSDGQQVTELRLNAYGQTERFTLFGEDGEAYLSHSTTYQNLRP